LIAPAFPMEARMQPTPRTQPSAVVNWSIRGQFIDQFHTAVVVVNGPPLKGPLITCRSRRPHWPQPLPTSNQRSPAAVVSYALATLAKSITRQKRHRLTTAKVGGVSVGGANVFH
jgi:hypothetical protein